MDERGCLSRSAGVPEACTLSGSASITTTRALVVDDASSAVSCPCPCPVLPPCCATATLPDRSWLFGYAQPSGYAPTLTQALSTWICGAPSRGGGKGDPQKEGFLPSGALQPSLWRRGAERQRPVVNCHGVAMVGSLCQYFCFSLTARLSPSRESPETSVQQQPHCLAAYDPAPRVVHLPCVAPVLRNSNHPGSSPRDAVIRQLAS